MYIIQQLVNAFSYGGILALLAIGYTMVYGILGLINFAHGEVFMIGAFVFYWVVVFLEVPFLIAILLAVLASVIVGVLLERGVYRQLFRHGAPVITVFIASFAASLGLRYIFMMFLGDSRRPFPIPSFMEKVYLLGPIAINLRDIVIFSTTVVVLITVALVIRYSKIGIAMRAVSYDFKTAEIMGVNSTVVVISAFIIGSALAALSAISYGMSYGVVNPSMGFEPGLKAFIAAVLGGVGNVTGAAIGGILIGVGEILFVALLPPELSGLRSLFVWALLFLILFVKPTGLFKPNVKFEGIWGE